MVVDRCTLHQHDLYALSTWLASIAFELGIGFIRRVTSSWIRVGASKDSGEPLSGRLDELPHAHRRTCQDEGVSYDAAADYARGGHDMTAVLPHIAAQWTDSTSMNVMNVMTVK